MTNERLQKALKDDFKDCTRNGASLRNKPRLSFLPILAGSLLRFSGKRNAALGVDVPLCLACLACFACVYVCREA